MERQLNKWQQHYIEVYYDGKLPRSKSGKLELELLGMVDTGVTVHFPDFGKTPAHTESFRVSLDECHMPNGIISVEVLSSNLSLWTQRGYRIDFE